jgi:stearoyl-CoA desaturase (delta-9 desaturase)
MKYISSSAYTLTFIQAFTSILSVIGLFYFEFDLAALSTLVLFYFLYSGVGVSMMMHRYWSHHSFEFKSEFLKWICTWFALMSGRGSIIGWVHVHREHHKYSDTEKDPHAPKYAKWRIYFPHMLNYGETINKFLIRDLINPIQLWINKYYMILVLAWVILLTLIDPWLLYFGWILPVALTQLILNSFIYFGHSVGYTNYDSTNDSKNLWPFGLLFWGEGWHNNHHKYPGRWSNQHKWWEIDPIAWVIRIIKK